MATSDGAKTIGCTIAMARAFVINPLWCAVLGMTLYEMEASGALWALYGVYIFATLIAGFCAFAFAVATADD